MGGDMKWGCDEIRSEWESLFAGIDEDNLPPLSSQWLGLRLDRTIPFHKKFVKGSADCVYALPKHERRRRSTAVASEMEKHHYVASLEMLSALRRPLSDSIEHIELWSYLVIKKNACFEDF